MKNYPKKFKLSAGKKLYSQDRNRHSLWACIPATFSLTFHLAAPPTLSFITVLQCAVTAEACQPCVCMRMHNTKYCTVEIASKQTLF